MAQALSNGGTVVGGLLLGTFHRDVLPAVCGWPTFPWSPTGCGRPSNSRGAAGADRLGRLARPFRSRIVCGSCVTCGQLKRSMKTGKKGKGATLIGNEDSAGSIACGTRTSTQAVQQCCLSVCNGGLLARTINKTYLKPFGGLSSLLDVFGPSCQLHRTKSVANA